MASTFVCLFVAIHEWHPHFTLILNGMKSKEALDFQDLTLRSLKNVLRHFTDCGSGEKGRV